MNLSKPIKKSIPKVYLAKSNRADPNEVSAIRELLKTFKVEIVEYCGGPYSHNQLLECDSLVVVPDSSMYDCMEHFVEVGKGLHNQIDIFLSTVQADNIFVVHNSQEHWMIPVSTVLDLEIEDEDNFVRYANLILNDDFGVDPMDTRYVSEESTLVYHMRELYDEKGCEEYYGDDSNFPSEFDKYIYLLIGE